MIRNLRRFAWATVGEGTTPSRALPGYPSRETPSSLITRKNRQHCGWLVRRSSVPRLSGGNSDASPLRTGSGATPRASSRSGPALRGVSSRARPHRARPPAGAVNESPDFVAHVAGRSKVRRPTMGKVRMARVQRPARQHPGTTDETGRSRSARQPRQGGVCENGRALSSLFFSRPQSAESDESEGPEEGDQ